MTQEIYFDMNVIINYIQFYTNSNHQHKNITKKINYLIKNTKNIYPYSPAHIEEIAVIERKAKSQRLAKKYINTNLKIISKISNDYEYLPTNNGIIIKKENPNICFDRVIEDYKTTTLIAEELEYKKVKKWKSINLGIDFSTINPQNIFQNEQILNELKKSLYPISIPKYFDIKENFYEIERIFEHIFDFLDNIGYQNDKKVYKNEKYRSRMHDITHGIYATKASIFVTSDNNLKNKLNAIYSLLEIPTQIILEKDFVLNKIN